MGGAIGSRFVRLIGYDGWMKAPSDLRMVISTLLVAAGFGEFLVAFRGPWTPAPWLAWICFLGSLPLIGAGLLHPFRRAILGAFIAMLIECAVFGWLMLTTRIPC